MRNRDHLELERISFFLSLFVIIIKLEHTLILTRASSKFSPTKEREKENWIKHCIRESFFASRRKKRKKTRAHTHTHTHTHMQDYFISRSKERKRKKRKEGRKLEQQTHMC
jgi:hypothetical protein